MKLLYDLRLLESRMHGMARYGLELLSALLELDEDLEIIAVLRRRHHVEQLPNDPRVSVIECKTAPYGLGAQIRRPRDVAEIEADLYHCPFYAPLARYPGPMAITIHDLIHLRFPKDYKLRHQLFYRWFLGPLARKVPLIITGSKHSKRDISELLGVLPGRIAVTTYGVGSEFAPLDPLARDLVGNRMGLPADYILGVGNPKPHKNLGALVAAHRQLSEQSQGTGGRLPPLVLLGVSAKDIAKHKPSDAVIALGPVDEIDLPGLYGAAEMVVLPSIYEGFGLPALEAMASGVPLISSNRASLPEVVGKAGILIDPTVEKLATAMARVHQDHELRSLLAEAGPRRAAEFTWARTAAETFAAYQQALGRGGRV